MRYILKIIPYLIFYALPVSILGVIGVDFLHQPTASRGILCVICGFCMGFWLGRTGNIRHLFHMQTDYDDLKEQLKRIKEELKEDKDHMHRLLKQHNIQWKSDH